MANETEDLTRGINPNLSYDSMRALIAASHCPACITGALEELTFACLECGFESLRLALWLHQMTVKNEPPAAA